MSIFSSIGSFLTETIPSVISSIPVIGDIASAVVSLPQQLLSRPKVGWKPAELGLTGIFSGGNIAKLFGEIAPALASVGLGGLLEGKHRIPDFADQLRQLGTLGTVPWQTGGTAPTAPPSMAGAFNAYQSVAPAYPSYGAPGGWSPSYPPATLQQYPVQSYYDPGYNPYVYPPRSTPPPIRYSYQSQAAPFTPSYSLYSQSPGFSGPSRFGGYRGGTRQRYRYRSGSHVRLR